MVGSADLSKSAVHVAKCVRAGLNTGHKNDTKTFVVLTARCISTTAVQCGAVRSRADVQCMNVRHLSHPLGLVQRAHEPCSRARII